MTLTEFLLARIAEDEEEARRHRAGRDYHGDPCPRCGRPVTGFAFGGGADGFVHEGIPGTCPDLPVGSVAAFMDGGLAPESVRVLAECEAKRKIVKDCQAVLILSDADDNGARLAPAVLQSLALPYADHPDYLGAWGP